MIFKFTFIFKEKIAGLDTSPRLPLRDIVSDTSIESHCTNGHRVLKGLMVCEEEGERRHLETWLGDSESGLLRPMFHCVLFPGPKEVCQGQGCFTAPTLTGGLSPCLRSLPPCLWSLPPCLSSFLISISWCLKPISKYLFILKM